VKRIIMLSIAGSIIYFSTLMPVSADPSPILLNFTCPNTTGTGANTLSNFGARIAGYGSLTVAGSPARAPYFTYTFSSGHFPDLIGSGLYTSSATSFNPVTAVVTCSYVSSGVFDPFTVSYQLTNGNGGVINSQTTSTISITQSVGLTVKQASN
jgi:hypothetical protein